MRGGLDLAQRRRRRLPVWAAVPVLLLALLWAMPRLCAVLPAAAEALDTALAARLVPRYTARLTALQAQNSALHRQLAQGQRALAENEALRAFVQAPHAEGRWQPARVTARTPGQCTLACRAEFGAAVLDAQGRYAGRITAADGETCTLALAGSRGASTAAFAGGCTGLYQNGRLTGLPAHSGLTAGTAVTTADGHWLGTLAEAPAPQPDGLTAAAPLTDTADTYSTIFFVNIA